jgi:hypothetical protein
MRIGRRFATLIAGFILLLACDSHSGYSLMFVCSSDAGVECPHDQECPTLPLGPNSCGDLPGVLGHEPIPATAGRPLGCRARLPYGNPHYGDGQVICTCQTFTPPRSPSWSCPI